MPEPPTRPDCPPCLVTGATGLLGSHIAERLLARGRPVRALVRPGADVRFLNELGVVLVEGDLTDPAACRRAVEGAGVVFHAAAKVGDWGGWAEFQRHGIDATANLARAAVESKVGRFVQISSTSAYGHPADLGRPIDETFPLGVGLWWPWDDYTRSKVECERLLWAAADREGLPLTVIRPSWLYGERDRTTIARLVKRARGRGIPLFGRGDNPLSAIYAGEVAEAAILAADDPGSAGEAYNVTDLGPITQREFFQRVAEAAGGRAGRWRHPYPLAFGVGFGLEAWGRFTRSRRPPALTRYAAWLMGRAIAYSSAKARLRLGWAPAIDYRTSLARAVEWFDRNVGSGRLERD